MTRARRSLAAVTVAAALLAGCSSSGTPEPSSSAPSATAAADAVQEYLDAVNALCDELLPKIIRVTHGGSVDVPVGQFLAAWPAHDRLHKEFDAQLARIPVPSAAKDEAAAFDAYLRFANQLNRARLRAAHKGQAAYDKEMLAEADAAKDPTIQARTAAGFHESCSAR